MSKKNRYGLPHKTLRYVGMLSIILISAPLIAVEPQVPVGETVTAFAPGNETPEQRQERFEAWLAANEDSDVQLSGFLAETRRLVAKQRDRETGWQPGDRNIESPPIILYAEGSGMALWECADCPEMVVIPAGSYTIGSPPDEAHRYDHEGPQRRITIERPFAVSRHEITRGQYAVFAHETQRSEGEGCFMTDDSGKQMERWRTVVATWIDPGFPQTDEHPVICVSREDALAYVQWLNDRTSGGYRLLSEAEWEYGARAGTTSPYPWGDEPNAGCVYANTADATLRSHFSTWMTTDCHDGAIYTAPVGSYRANEFGLHDMIGNVWEMVQDCYADSHADIPLDGSTSETLCSLRVIRGAAWYVDPTKTRSAMRNGVPPSGRGVRLGFRIAKTLD